MNFLLICLFLLFINTSAKEEKLPKNQFLYNLIQPSCSKAHFWVILVDQPRNDSSNQTDNSRHLQNGLLKMRCNLLHLPNISLTELNSRMASYRYLNLQFIFDYTTSPELSQGQFTETLERLSLFYFNCSKCQPLIVLWGATLHLKLEKWSQASLTLHSVRHLQALFLIQDTLLQYRPIGAGCLPTNELLIGLTDPTGLRTLPESECNLHSSRLNVSVNDDFPYCRIKTTKEGNVIREYSVEMQLLDVFERRLNFTGNLVDAGNNWGMLIRGHWVGTIGHVFEGTSAFGLCEVGKTIRRMGAVDFSEFLFLDEKSFISQSGKLQRHDLLFNEKISSILKIAILLSWISISLVIYRVSVFHRKRLPFPEYDSTLLALLGVYLKQPMFPHFRASISSLRLLYSTWMLSCVVLSNLFSSLFYSALTVPAYSPSIDTVQDLSRIAQSDSHFILMKGMSGYHATFANGSPEVQIDFLISEHLKRTKQKMLATQSELVKTADRRDDVVVLGGKQLLQANRYLFARKHLHIGSENIGQTYLAVPVQRRSPLTRHFNRIIVPLREMGIIDHWLRETIRRLASEIGYKGVHQMEGNPNTSGPTSKKHRKNFSLNDLVSVYWTWSLGMLSSTVAFIGEFALRRLKGNCLFRCN